MLQILYMPEKTLFHILIKASDYKSYHDTFSNKKHVETSGFFSSQNNESENMKSMPTICNIY